MTSLSKSSTWVWPHHDSLFSLNVSSHHSNTVRDVWPLWPWDRTSVLSTNIHHRTHHYPSFLECSHLVNFSLLSFSLLRWGMHAEWGGIERVCYFPNDSAPPPPPLFLCPTHCFFPSQISFLLLAHAPRLLNASGACGPCWLVWLRMHPGQGRPDLLTQAVKIGAGCGRAGQGKEPLNTGLQLQLCSSGTLGFRTLELDLESWLPTCWSCGWCHYNSLKFLFHFLGQDPTTSYHQLDLCLVRHAFVMALGGR